jgi:anthranilate synthase/aminodeoxychorismate synthase-like glutamine amidotransferase
VNSILFIDNYDSFVYNLYQYFAEIVGEENVSIFRNDKIDINKIKKINPSLIVLSPGPGTPQESKICVDIIKELQGIIPIFGICLGYQAIVEVFGGVVIPSGKPRHGYSDKIKHDGKTIYENCTPDYINVGRYHSLIADSARIPDCLEVTSFVEGEGPIMGVRHKTLPIEGVQFHPESILTPEGKTIIKSAVNSFCRS